VSSIKEWGEGVKKARGEAGLIKESLPEGGEMKMS